MNGLPRPAVHRAIALTVLLATLTLAACGATTGTTSQPMPVARTPEQIKGDCWMKYEGDTKMNIDKRAALVDACITERSKSGAPIN
jgi:ABC-type glycerol-3-phosphate transport system substrate-binding protein